MDIYAIDADHHVYNVELQKITAGFPFICAEAHSANLLLTSMEKGKERTELEEEVQTTVITIFDDDPHGRGEPLYNVIAKWDDNNEPVPTHQHIIYVNGSYQGNDALGILMKDLHETDAGKINALGLRNRITYLKTTEGGNREMFEYFREHYGDELRAEYAKGQAAGCEESRREEIRRTMRILQSYMKLNGCDLGTAMELLDVETEMRELLMAELQKQAGISPINCPLNSTYENSDN